MSQATYKCKACSESVIWKMFGNDGYCLKCQTLRDAAPDMYEAIEAFVEATKAKDTSLLTDAYIKCVHALEKVAE